jgi:hypothetical protein
MRAKVVRSMQGALAFGAFFILTGAKGDGCGGLTDGDDGNTSTGSGGGQVECPPGSHLETKCDDYGIYCWDECVSDEYCPEGTVLDYYCDPVPLDQPLPDCDPMQQDCGGCDPMIDPNCGGGGQCYPICVPVDPCGPDSHEEWICEDTMEPVDFCNEPPPGCYPICVPNNNCGPGQHEEWVCTDNGMDADCEPMNQDCGGGGECYPVCVPDPVCPPGTHEQIECVQTDPAESEMIPPEECWITCVPDSLCEPGYHEEIVCETDPMDPSIQVCYNICVPDDPTCPDGTQPVQVCADDGMGGFFCWLECVGEEPPPME